MKIYCDSSTTQACIVINKEKPVIRAHFEQVTNNVGEYLAVLRALDLCQRKNWRGVEILTDSLLVVNQIKTEEEGGWKCRSPHLLPFITASRRLAQETGAEVKWIPREENLAGLVLDGKEIRQ